MKLKSENSGWVAVKKTFIARADLNDTAKWMLIYLKGCPREKADGKPFTHSVPSIASGIGRSEKSVRRQIDWFVKEGVLNLYGTMVSSKTRYNIYTRNEKELSRVEETTDKLSTVYMLSRDNLSVDYMLSRDKLSDKVSDKSPASNNDSSKKDSSSPGPGSQLVETFSVSGSSFQLTESRPAPVAPTETLYVSPGAQRASAISYSTETACLTSGDLNRAPEPFSGDPTDRASSPTGEYAVPEPETKPNSGGYFVPSDPVPLKIGNALARGKSLAAVHDVVVRQLNKQGGEFYREGPTKTSFGNYDVAAVDPKTRLVLVTCREKSFLNTAHVQGVCRYAAENQYNGVLVYVRENQSLYTMDRLRPAKEPNET